MCSIFTAAGENLGLTTVVIDAGHGGKDAGCVSKDQKTYEKTLTLDIATTLAGKIRKAYPEVKVVLTRSDDTYVTLDDRAEIANDAHADLFISVHINANEKTSPSGYSVHVLGQSSNKNRDLFANNMEVCVRENSVIMLEDDYSTKYQGFDPSDPESYIFMMLMQNSHREQSLRFAEEVQTKLAGGPIKNDRGVSQDPFYVLWKTSMPAVLVELGFISNSTDLAALRKQSGRDNLAQRLFEAFRDYKKFYDESLRFDGGAAESARTTARSTRCRYSPAAAPRTTLRSSWATPPWSLRPGRSANISSPCPTPARRPSRSFRRYAANIPTPSLWRYAARTSSR